MCWVEVSAFKLGSPKGDVVKPCLNNRQDEGIFHSLAIAFDLFKDVQQAVLFGRLAVEEAGLGGTHIPGADKRTPDAVQPTALRTCEAAMFVG